MTTTLHARAVLLDMDGTLVDSTAVVERLWLEWAAPHALDSAHVLRVVHGRQGHQSMAILLPDREHEVNVVENEQMLAKESGDVTGVVEIPGATALLEGLRGHPHAIVTSADVALMTARMDAAGLTIPAVQITAESVSASKPDPEGFLAGAAALGVAPADCVVFEDSEVGIQAGLAAGMQVVGVGARAADHNPTFTVPNLSHVRVVSSKAGLTISLD